jgi:multidrug resistance efflux pump
MSPSPKAKLNQAEAKLNQAEAKLNQAEHKLSCAEFFSFSLFLLRHIIFSRKGLS